MRLGGRRAGSLTQFVDAATDEALLEVGADQDGAPVIGFRLYDCNGKLVSESQGRKCFPEGLEVVSQGASGEGLELLLLVPRNPEENIQYRLYNSSGRLLAVSDGARTQIYGMLRMEAPKPGPNARRATTT